LPDEGAGPPRAPWRKPAGFALGLAALIALLLPPPPAGLDAAGWRVAGAALLMAIWWLTEALPVAVTALVPLVLFPALGVRGAGDTAAAFGDPLIFLFLGGFLIAAAIERWGLHQRIAMRVLTLARGRPRLIVLGFLLSAAFISLWVSNTATAAMLLPVGLSTLRSFAPAGEGAPVTRPLRNLRAAALLAIAYGATIGGVGTLISTPPNALFAAYSSDVLNRPVSFLEWLAIGMPLVIVLLPLAWIWLAFLAFPLKGVAPLSAKLIPASREKLQQPAILTACVFVLTATLWVTRPVYENVIPGWRIGDTEIALFGALLLFILPSGRPGSPALLDWSVAPRLPWGTLILFGGGLALADAIESSGLAAWLGRGLGDLEGVPTIALVAALAALVIALSELASNTAIAAIFLPLVGAAAIGLGSDAVALAVPTVLAASLAFMMPVGTPPNAIVFGTGHVGVGQMARAGLVLNLLSLVVIVLIGYPLALMVLG